MGPHERKLKALVAEGWHPTDAEVQAAIDQLTPRQREVLNLCRLQGCSQSEAARRLEIARQVVGRRLAKATERWAQAMCGLPRSPA